MYVCVILIVLKNEIGELGENMWMYGLHIWLSAHICQNYVMFVYIICILITPECFLSE